MRHSLSTRIHQYFIKYLRNHSQGALPGVKRRCYCVSNDLHLHKITIFLVTLGHSGECDYNDSSVITPYFQSAAFCHFICTICESFLPSYVFRCLGGSNNSRLYCYPTRCCRSRRPGGKPLQLCATIAHQHLRRGAPIFQGSHLPLLLLCTLS